MDEEKDHELAKKIAERIFDEMEDKKILAHIGVMSLCQALSIIAAKNPACLPSIHKLIDHYVDGILTFGTTL